MTREEFEEKYHYYQGEVVGDEEFKLILLSNLSDLEVFNISESAYNRIESLKEFIIDYFNVKE
jgi:hypothetical protein